MEKGFNVFFFFFLRVLGDPLDERQGGDGRREGKWKG